MTSKYSYYYEKQKQKQSYKKIKNIDQIVFWVCMTPVIIFYVSFYIAVKLIDGGVI